jgi:hypothetical protein
VHRRWYGNCGAAIMDKKELVMTFINEGTWDRAIRILMGGALVYGAWVSWPATISIVMLAIGAVALTTGVVGWCPAYRAFGISTRKKIAA